LFVYQKLFDFTLVNPQTSIFGVEQHQDFFVSILQCSHTSNHPQKELAKFGYKSERKAENFINPAVYLELAEACCLNKAIQNFSPQKSANLGAFFSHISPLYVLQWIFFCHQVAEILACINKSKVTFSGSKAQKIGSVYHNFTTQSTEEGMSNHLGHN
jgi:hypothetical protein